MITIPKKSLYLRLDPYALKVLLYMFDKNDDKKGVLFHAMNAAAELQLSEGVIRRSLKTLSACGMITAQATNDVRIGLSQVYYINGVDNWQDDFNYKSGAK